MTRIPTPPIDAQDLTWAEAPNHKPVTDPGAYKDVGWELGDMAAPDKWNWLWQAGFKDIRFLLQGGALPHADDFLALADQVQDELGVTGLIQPQHDVGDILDVGYSGNNALPRDVLADGVNLFVRDASGYVYCLGTHSWSHSLSATGLLAARTFEGYSVVVYRTSSAVRAVMVDPQGNISGQTDLRSRDSGGNLEGITDIYGHVHIRSDLTIIYVAEGDSGDMALMTYTWDSVAGQWQEAQHYSDNALRGCAANEDHIVAFRHNATPLLWDGLLANQRQYSQHYYSSISGSVQAQWVGDRVVSVTYPSSLNTGSATANVVLAVWAPVPSQDPDLLPSSSTDPNRWSVVAKRIQSGYTYPILSSDGLWIYLAAVDGGNTLVHRLDMDGRVLETLQLGGWSNQYRIGACAGQVYMGSDSKDVVKRAVLANRACLVTRRLWGRSVLMSMESLT